MAGYTLLISSKPDLDRMLPLFRQDEVTSVQLGHDKILTYVSNSGSLTQGALFQGYSIDHIHERMVFSGAPAAVIPHPSEPVDGSYFSATFDRDSVTCGADLYGYVSMVWFHDSSVFAVSDSFLTLIAIRRALKLPVTLNESTVKSRSWLNTMGAQQIGTETYCNEISYCLAGTALEFNFSKNDAWETPLQLETFYEGSFIDHADAITTSAKRMVRTMKTYAATDSFTSLALSGGLDSRLCLAAVLSADVRERLHIASTDNGTADYTIAVELSEEYDFPRNRSSPEIQGTLIPNDVLAGWAAGSMGLYDALYMPKKFRRLERPVFVTGGHGAGLARGAYGWRKLSEINMPSDAQQQARSSLATLNIDPDDPWGSEWHYLAHRGPLHSGRAILSTDYLARPTAQIPLIGLSRSSENQLPAPGRNQANVILDTLLKLEPALARHRFDTPGKNQSKSVLEERLHAIGGVLSYEKLEPYAVFGSARPSKGILASHLDIAKKFGFTGALDWPTVAPKMEQALEACSDLLSREVQEVLENANNRDTRRLSSSSRQGTAIGKLMAVSSVL